MLRKGPRAYIALTRGEGYVMLEGDVWEGEGRCGAGLEMRGAKGREFDVLYRGLWGHCSGRHDREEELEQDLV